MMPQNHDAILPNATSPDATLAELRQLLAELVAIGAPTFGEANRARFIAGWLRRHTDATVAEDEIGNVLADLSDGAEKVHLLDAHIDTVFPDERVNLIQDGEIWRAPGIIDNTAACAILMMWLQSARGCGPLPFVASFTVGEENEGNLRGIQQVAADFGPRLFGACVLDLRLEAGCRQSVGSQRYHLQWQASGGHSWGQFGNASAIHEMARWIHDLGEKFSWQNGVRSHNVGLVEGGQGATSIAQNARLKLDVRSVEADFLADFSAWMSGQIGEFENVTLSQLARLERPAGSVPPNHALVTMLEEVHTDLQIPLSWNITSTNANALQAAGIPAIATGLTLGAGIHSADEHLEVASLGAGVRKLDLISQHLLRFSKP